MNINFLKLSAADASWLLILPNQLEGDKSKLAGKLARSLCNPVEGLQSSGIIVPELGDGMPVMRIFSRYGLPLKRAGSACLAASRWLLDNGLTDHERVVFESFSGIVEIIPIDMRFLGMEIQPGILDGQLRRQGIPPASGISNKLYLGSLEGDTGETKVRVTLWDGPIPSRLHLKVFMGSSAHIPEVHAGIFSREALSVAVFNADPVDAAALALQASIQTGYTADELTVQYKKVQLLAQKDSENKIFIGAEARYSIKGEYWFPEE